MKTSQYDSLYFRIPDRVSWIAKNANGVFYGYSEEPKWVKGEWVMGGDLKWYIGIYEVGLVASESLVCVENNGE